MGFLDKVKAGAEQAKEMAGAAADKAKQEAKELQLKRELNDAFDDLGKATFERIESGERPSAGRARPRRRSRPSPPSRRPRAGRPRCPRDPARPPPRGRGAPAGRPVVLGSDRTFASAPRRESG